MLNEGALLHCKDGPGKLLGFMPMQKPVVCQLGGNNPEKMAKAAQVVEEHGFDEVNVNCGCPSDKVCNGSFGAILMFDPKLVAEIVLKMRNAVQIPVTVKCRLGVDDRDKWDEIVEFIRVVSEEGGCTKFIIHARKCFLSGLNPAQNRNIPPLNYAWVFKLAEEFPHLNFVINGGFDSVEKINDILSDEQPLLTSMPLEGCMSGRLAMNNTWELARIDREVFEDLE